MWNWDWTVRAGDVLTLMGALIVAFTIFYKRGRAEQQLTDALQAALRDIAEIKTEMRIFSATITKIAVQETQIGFLMKWYDELRRGKGYVTDE